MCIMGYLFPLVRTGFVLLLFLGQERESPSWSERGRAAAAASAADADAAATPAVELKPADVASSTPTNSVQFPATAWIRLACCPRWCLHAHGQHHSGTHQFHYIMF